MANPEYGNKNYWEERYKTKDTFDWLEDYDSLKEILKNILNKFSRPPFILNVGCGNSLLSEELYEKGYKNIANIDYCKNVIDFMAERNKEYKEMKWYPVDVREMNWQNNTYFDLIIDKCLMDCILCGDNSYEELDKMLKRIHYYLKPNGTYLVISHERPKNRTFHLEKYFKVTEMEILNQFEGMKDVIHYAYICTKK